MKAWNFNEWLGLISITFMLYLLVYKNPPGATHDALIVFLTLVFQYFYRKAKSNAD